MTVADAVMEARASRRNALVRRLYGEFPQVPAGAVADAVLHAWGDMPQRAEDGASGLESIERAARQRLHEWGRRAELASARVRANRRTASTRFGAQSHLRHSA